MKECINSPSSTKQLTNKPTNWLTNSTKYSTFTDVKNSSNCQKSPAVFGPLNFNNNFTITRHRSLLPARCIQSTSSKSYFYKTYFNIILELTPRVSKSKSDASSWKKCKYSLKYNSKDFRVFYLMKSLASKRNMVASVSHRATGCPPPDTVLTNQLRKCPRDGPSCYVMRFPSWSAQTSLGSRELSNDPR